MSKTVRFKVQVPVGYNSNMAGFYLAALFDMLRYDGATVLDWAENRKGGKTSSFTLLLEGKAYTPARWGSVGIPTWVSEN
jgi:hypothetical protein